MVKEKEIKEETISDDELGVVDLGAGDKLEKKLKSNKNKVKASDKDESEMEAVLKEIKRKEEIKREVRSEMLEIRIFNTREDVMQFQDNGGRIYQHTSNYPMEALIVKDEYKEILTNKKN